MSLLPINERRIYDGCIKDTLKETAILHKEINEKNTVHESDTLSESTLTLSDKGLSSVSNISSLTSLQEEDNICRQPDTSFPSMNDNEDSMPMDTVQSTRLEPNDSTREFITDCNARINEKQQKRKNFKLSMEKKLETIISYEMTSKRQTLPIPESILFITKLIDSNVEHNKKNVYAQHERTCRICLR
jgi:hypothetical protein